MNVVCVCKLPTTRLQPTYHHLAGGSTSLCEYLWDHPMIAVPEALPGGIPRKEISFFTNDYNYNMGLAEYERILYVSQSEGQLGLDCTQNQILFRTAAQRVKSAFSGKKVGIMSICILTTHSSSPDYVHRHHSRSSRPAHVSAHPFICILESIYVPMSYTSLLNTAHIGTTLLI